MTLTTTPAEIVAKAEASGAPGLLGRHPAWVRVSVGKLVRIVNGAPFSSRLFNNSGVGLPLIRIRDVGVNSPTTFYDGPFDASMVVRRGDLLVGMDGDFNVARWTGPEGLLNQRVCRLEVMSEDLDERWLLHALQGYLDAIWAETSSVTVKHLSSKSIAQVPLPLPPLEEQRRIVDLLEDHLSRLEAAEREINAASAKADTLALASCVNLFSRGTPSSEVLTFGDHALMVPEGWRSCRLHEVAQLVEYGTGSKTSEGADSESVPVLRMGNLKNGRLELSKLKYLPASHPDFPKLLLQPGDLLFNRTNSAEHVGKSAVFHGDLEAASFASYLIRVRFCEDLLPEWANIVINSPYGRSYVASVVTQQVGQANVNGTKLKSFPIPVPPLEVQQALVEEHEEVLGSTRRLHHAVAALQMRGLTLRRSLLAAAFSGQLNDRDLVREGTDV